MNKQQAKIKIAAAEKASMTALSGMRKAGDALSVSVPINGFGVLGDPQAMRRQLEQAQALIKDSLAVMDAAEWPTDAEYDLF